MSSLICLADRDAVDRRHLGLVSPWPESQRAADIPILPVSAETFEPVVGAMELLAKYSPEGHRIPISDLLTAVIGNEHGAGVLHCDGDFELLSEHAGLDFPENRLEFE